MRDLTSGSITRHIVTLTAPLALGMVFQTLYHFVDLYFVAALGEAAVAGVSAAGNAIFVVFAATQTLGVGTVALISQAVGRQDQQGSNLVFNQALGLAMLSGLATVMAGVVVTVPYMRAVTADEATVQAAVTYLLWFAPGLALQFVMVVMASALRGTGIVNLPIVVQVFTLVLNALLAPLLIAGWGGGQALGIAGAGLASSISIGVGSVLLCFYFVRLERYVTVVGGLLRPRLEVCRRLLQIGLPSGGEFLLIFAYNSITYWAIRGFGPAAQAGFGVGSRVMQGVFVPALAIAFATAPIAGQNFGAGRYVRVRGTFKRAVALISVVMMALTVLCHWDAEWLVRPFSRDPEVLRVGLLFLHLISWNFVAQGIIFTCSSMFQGLGNTLPSIASSGARLFTYALPAAWFSLQPFFRLEYLWYWSIVTTRAIVSKVQ